MLIGERLTSSPLRLVETSLHDEGLRVLCEVLSERKLLVALDVSRTILGFVRCNVSYHVDTSPTVRVQAKRC